MKPAASSPRLLPFAATWLAYAVVAWMSLWLAVPPSYAAPLYPAAGIALAMLLRHGWRTLPAIGLASLAVNLLWQLLHGRQDTSALWIALALAGGATLQSATALALVRRFVGPAPALSEPLDIARFFLLGALLANVIGASVATLTLAQAGVVSPGGLMLTWCNWWVGDTLGVLIAAPLVLTLIGQPQSDWAPRRAWIGLPLLLATALLAAATAHSNFIEQRRALGLFERDAAGAADALAAELQVPLHALEAMHGLFLANDALTGPGLSAAALQNAAGYWLQRPFHLQALGWAQRVPRAGVPAFEQAVQADSGRPGYHVFDRADAPAGVAAEAEVLAIRNIEPALGNTAALGVNILSVPAARDAAAAARGSGEARATPGFRLTQEAEQTGTGIVLYQAVYRGQPTTDAEREAATVGVLFATLRMEEAVNGVMARLPRTVRWCLLDTEPGGAGRQLAGSPDCVQRADDEFNLVRLLSYGGRRWALHLHVPPVVIAPSLQWNGVVFSLVGLAAAAMLSTLLLSVTGRTRRIEVAVAQRTADLQHEVAERQRTEAALRESEARLRNILDNVPLGVVYTDLEGAIEDTNPHFREMAGYPAGELLGMNVLRLTPPEQREEAMAMMAGLLSGALGPQRRRWLVLRRDGTTRLAQSTSSLLRDAQGRPQRIVGVVEDIGEQVRFEEAERARESAEAANRAKSEFVSRMSHELRTPLNAMLGFAQLLGLDRQQPLTANQLEWTSQIQQAGWHLLHMINDTLDLSRIESGTVKLELQPVELAEMVAATRVLVDQAAQRRKLTLSEQLEPRAPAVLADATRLKQILTNLLSNAVKYNVDGGHIAVLSRLLDARTVEIEVRDSGMGMDSAQMAELFQPFNRLGRESFGEGTGIGLVISRRLAELMGGTLEARSSAGQGSSFLLTLPRAPLDHPVRSRPAPLQALPSDYRQRIVHYIEDNETNAEVMRGILAQRPQVRLEVSGNGLDGLAAIRLQTPSLVLLDMHLPDIDGLELLRHLKADPQTVDIPVIVVSADATVARIEEALQAGAVHYITKPVNVGDMLTTLDELLEQLDTRFG